MSAATSSTGAGTPSDAPPKSLSVVDSGCLAELEGSARLLWALIEADGGSYQLVIAERPAADGAGHLQGHENALIGTIGDRVYYGATIDSEMAVALLRAASGGLEEAERARPLGRRAVQHVARLRRPPDLEAVPPALTGPQPGRGSDRGAGRHRLQPHRSSRSSAGSAMATIWLSGSSTWLEAPTAGRWRLPRCVISMGRPAPRTRPARPCLAAISRAKRPGWAR